MHDEAVLPLDAGQPRAVLTIAYTSALARAAAEVDGRGQRGMCQS